MSYHKKVNAVALCKQLYYKNKNAEGGIYGGKVDSSQCGEMSAYLCFTDVLQEIYLTTKSINNDFTDSNIY